ncbi:hypothetical protein KC660_03705 [Candidatus Dojkabacteria bacterium]|uniref:Uncharacterized protein n=1 Tax=Candidatus Dojkabacteria bacterium TaxID=2099670 RepID=A0A955RIK9_9BACT|nr:hypothetical protein [Candidatus Dojkabacteria bacterium]
MTESAEVIFQVVPGTNLYYFELVPRIRDSEEEILGIDLVNAVVDICKSCRLNRGYKSPKPRCYGARPNPMIHHGDNAHLMKITYTTSQISEEGVRQELRDHGAKCADLIEP